MDLRNLPIVFRQERPAQRVKVEPMFQHPHRALPPGKQWNPHDGKKAKARRRRQAMALAEERLKKQFGSRAVVAQEPDGGLILDFSK